MSYDIWLEIDTGNGNVATVDNCLNYTSNVARMWHTAIQGAVIGGVQMEALYDLDELEAGTCAPALRHAIAAMLADPQTYAAMNPANGWGDAEGAREFLEKVADLCEAHPSMKVRISR